jgi:4-hydroxyacetophenone monooxygenase
MPGVPRSVTNDDLEKYVRGGPEVLLQCSLAQLTNDLACLQLRNLELEDRIIAELQRCRDSGEDLPALPEVKDREFMRALIAHAAEEPMPGRETSSTGAKRVLPEVTDMTVALMTDEMTGMSTGDDVAFTPEEVSDFHVVICGAGASGICMGIKLGMAGIPYTIVERYDNFGGTWLANQYPDAGCDVPSHFYSYSFEPNTQWTGFYSKAAEIRDYFTSIALKYGIQKQTRFNTEVVQAVYNDASSTWEVEVKNANGAVEVIKGNVFVSAVGQLSNPNIPPIPGIERFKGKAMHTANWDNDYSHKGKQACVIGTGASAMQVVRTVAPQVEKLTIFQQIPSWAAPQPLYHKQVGDGMRWRLANVPFYERWFRFQLFWTGGDGNYEALVAGSEKNKMAKTQLTQYIKHELGHDEELIKKCLPDYPPFCSRVLIDNEWFKTMTRPNVDLITSPVTEVTETGVVADGQHYEVDTLIWGTGFKANKFLWPIHVVGKGGTTLEDFWQQNPAAYKGLTIPSFPNLYMCYGPNTNIGHGGSIIFHSECQVRYIKQCIVQMLQASPRLASLECRPQVYDDYNKRAIATLDTLVWGDTGCTSWYKTPSGRIVNNSPWRLADYWEMTKEVDMADYHIETVATRSRL